MTLPCIFNAMRRASFSFNQGPPTYHMVFAHGFGVAKLHWRQEPWSLTGVFVVQYGYTGTRVKPL